MAEKNAMWVSAAISFDDATDWKIDSELFLKEVCIRKLGKSWKKTVEINFNLKIFSNAPQHQFPILSLISDDAVKFSRF